MPIEHQSQKRAPIWYSSVAANQPNSVSNLMGGSEMPLFLAADGAGREARPLPVSWAFLFVLPFGEAVCTRKKGSKFHPYNAAADQLRDHKSDFVS